MIVANTCVSKSFVHQSLSGWAEDALLFLHSGLMMGFSAENFCLRKVSWHLRVSLVISHLTCGFQLVSVHASHHPGSWLLAVCVCVTEVFLDSSQTPLSL